MITAIARLEEQAKLQEKTILEASVTRSVSAWVKSLHLWHCVLLLLQHNTCCVKTTSVLEFLYTLESLSSCTKHTQCQRFFVLVCLSDEKISADFQTLASM